MAIIAVVAVVAGACDDADTATNDRTAPVAEGPRVVASTSWTGAFAKAAGASDIRVIAPPEFQHPPDYEPRPSDLLAVREAEFLIVGGIERFVDRIKEAAGGQATLVQVDLRNTSDGIRAEVKRLAQLFGTEPRAEEFLARFVTVYDHLGQDLRVAQPDDGRPLTVAANRVQAWWAELAGLRVVTTFPNEPLSPQQIADVAAAKPDLVFDNANVPGAAVLAQQTGAERVLLSNFPDENLDLIALFQANASRISDAVRKRRSR